MGKSKNKTIKRIGNYRVYRKQAYFKGNPNAFLYHIQIKRQSPWWVTIDIQRTEQEALKELESFPVPCCQAVRSA